MKVLSRAEGFEGWLQDIILRDVFIPKLEVLYANFGTTMLDKLQKEDGYRR
jgi:hypothetical protein